MPSWITFPSSTTTSISAYTTFTALIMLIRTVINEVESILNQIIPQKLREMIVCRFSGVFGRLGNQMTIIVDERRGYVTNEIFQAAEVYLGKKISTFPVDQLKISKGSCEKDYFISLNKGEKVVDEFRGVPITWELVCTETNKTNYDDENYTHSTETSEQRSYNISFPKSFKDTMMNTYFPYIIDISKAIKEDKKVVKLCIAGHYDQDSIALEHPLSFDNLAMEPELKEELIKDLDRFVKRKDFYRRVGKPWKRGYLLYGPPGTGKSSLVVAMANYLKFDIYDLELASAHSNTELRRMLLSTTNRSILVIEDIDCSVELQDREEEGSSSGSKKVSFAYLFYHTYTNGFSNLIMKRSKQLTLSGLLNAIDGLWSGCGDERIIVFTTNHKDKLDPALLRPGRMDVHVHMSYLTYSGFEILALNYLQIKTHKLFTKIEEVIKEVEVTPAEIAEQLMRREDADMAMEGVLQYLLEKKSSLEMQLEPKNNDDEIVL